MKTTPLYGIRYPERSDPPDLPTQLSNLDNDVNAALDMLLPDSGVVTGDGTTTGLTVTPETGWAVTETQYRTIGPKMWARLEFQRTGAAITASTTGNFTDTTIGTISDTAHRPAIVWYGPYRATVTSGLCTVKPTGVVTITDGHSGSTIDTGDNLYIYLPVSVGAGTGTFASGTRGLYFPTSGDRPIGDDDTPQIDLTAETIDDALTALIPDSGTRTDAPVTPAAGYSLLLAEYRLIGKDMTLHVWLQRDGAAVTANTSGNIAGDPAMFTIDDAALRPSLDFIVGQYRASRTSGVYQINSSGVASVYDAHSSSSIPTNSDDQTSTVQVYANYPIP